MAPNHVTVSKVDKRRLNLLAVLPSIGAAFVKEAALGQFEERWHYSGDSIQPPALLLAALLVAAVLALSGRLSAFSSREGR